MAYITVEDLEARLGSELYARLTDREAGVSANSGVAQQIVDEAESLLDGYLARRYATPIDVSGDAGLANVLALRSLDLAEFLAWRGSPFTSDVPERARLAFDETQRWLARVADGRLALAAASPPRGASASGAQVQYESRPRRFTHDELDGL